MFNNDDLLQFTISDNFSDKFFDNQRLIYGEEKEVNLWIKDVTARNGYKYILPNDILDRPDADYIINCCIEKWDSKHNRDVYGNKVHIFTTSKVTNQIIEQYKKYKNTDIIHDQNQIKMFRKDGTLDDNSKEFKNLITSFITQSSSENKLEETIKFEDEIINQLKNINLNLQKMFELIKENHVQKL